MQSATLSMLTISWNVYSNVVLYLGCTKRKFKERLAEGRNEAQTKKIYHAGKSSKEDLVVQDY